MRKPTEPPAFDPSTPPAVDPSQIRVSEPVVAPPAQSRESAAREESAESQGSSPRSAPNDRDTMAPVDDVGATATSAAAAPVVRDVPSTPDSTAQQGQQPMRAAAPPPSAPLANAQAPRAPIIDDDADALMDPYAPPAAPPVAQMVQPGAGNAPLGSNPSATGSSVGSGLSTTPLIPPPTATTTPSAATTASPGATPNLSTPTGVPAPSMPGTTIGVDSLGQSSSTVPGTATGVGGTSAAVPGSTAGGVSTGAGAGVTGSASTPGSVLPAPANNAVLPAPLPPTTGVPTPSGRQPGTVDQTYPLATPDQTR